MRPQALGFLEKAQTLLDEAGTMLNVGLTDQAGRTAYIAGFHTAQTLIFDRIGKVLKSHKGVQAEFRRWPKNDSRIDSELRGFLSRTYNLKAIADYETGPGSHVPREEATAALEAAKEFLACVTSLLTAAT